MQIIDPAHPFYRPLWRRIAIVAVLGAWLAFEVFIGKNTFFMVITAALLAHAAWVLLYKYAEPKP